MRGRLSTFFRRRAAGYGPHYGVATQGYLRGLGLLYVLSFWSFAAQAMALSGPSGLQPMETVLAFLQERAGFSAVLEFPSLFWFGGGNALLLGVCGVGMAGGLALLWGAVPWFGALVAWICYVSLIQACRPWLGLPGDLLLAEMGVPALLMVRPMARTYPPVERMASRLTGIVLLNALLCKLMLGSGLSQLYGGDAAWPRATALYHFFEVTPLPTAPAWYFHHLPQTLLEYGVWGLLFVEIALPVYVALPRTFRNLAAGGVALVSILLLVTGHYGFLPLQCLLLALTLVDDVSWRLLLPERWGPPASTGLYRPRLGAGLVFAAILPLMVLQAFPPTTSVWALPWRGVEAVLSRVGAANRYPLFSQVPETRFELSLQGSANGRDWIEYRFALKPTDPRSIPPVSVLHLPRLDDQLARLASRVEKNPEMEPPLWFKRFSLAVLSGHPSATSLLPVNPFPEAPPQRLRWVLYAYRFADPVTRREEDVWWIREPLGLYGKVLQRSESPDSAR